MGGSIRAVGDTLEPDLVHVKYVATHHRLGVTAEPPPCSGPGHTERSDEAHVTGDTDQLT